MSRPAMTHAECIGLVRVCATSLRLAANPAHRWLGETLVAWLDGGGSLDAALGVKPPRGSRRTPQEIVRRELADSLLLALARDVGDEAAGLMVSGAVPPPDELAALVERLRSLGVSASRWAISRARARVRG